MLLHKTKSLIVIYIDDIVGRPLFKILGLFCICQFAQFAYADGPYVMSHLGGLKPLKKTSVRLVDQYTAITLHPEGYEIGTKFKFFNPNESEIINVGFPEEKMDTAPDTNYFQTKVNGKDVLVTSGTWACTGIEDSDESLCKRIWSSRIEFKGKGFTEAEIKSKEDYSPDTSISGYSVFYDYSNGGLWAGNVRKLTFEVIFDDTNFPAFRFLKYTMPLRGWSIVTSSTSMEDTNSEAKGYIFQSIEYERRLNSMKWVLKDYNPLNADCFWIGLQSKATIEEINRVKTTNTDGTGMFSNVNFNEINQFGIILGITKDESLSEKIKNGYKKTVWLRKELRE